MDRSVDIAIVGGGIVGLAHAYMALRKGYRVVLFEREQFAVGASVRNFGLVWPIGQEPGVMFDRAMRSRRHWQEMADSAGFWINNNRSLHLAYHEDEWDVLEEFMKIYKDEAYECSLLPATKVASISSVVKTEGLIGGLLSETESTVYAREAIRTIPYYLVERYGLVLRFGHVVTEISLPTVKTARETWQAQRVYVCSGADFETLYPLHFDKHQVTKCKLQMLKAVPDRPVSIGPTLCAGLTLRHYAAFSKCKSLPALDKRYDELSETYKRHGIHVLLGQNAAGELIIGDSHHYSMTVEPFDLEPVTDAILDYLSSFTQFGKLTITERWNGVYPKLPGATELVLQPEPNVTVVTCLSGAGMTLSFGLAEEHLAQL
ncbi:MAG: TIGR03364 family FAD-dependent oxidoreductase [Chryseolinea sp.]